ncbi:MAG: hypothetical protein AB2A00_30845 [Myxococcota bacterium]
MQDKPAESAAPSASSSSGAPAAGGHAAWDPAWSGLCPASGATAPMPIRASGAGTRFEPSAAAVWDGRVAIAGDKQVHLWWWRPGTSDVVDDPAWSFPLTQGSSSASCCAQQPGDWGDAIKRQKAAETCGDHAVALGSPLPWLKVEGAASTPHALYLGANMGFACQENNHVLRVERAGESPVPLPNVSRETVLQALGALDVRVEGVAMTADGTTALIAARQKNVGRGDALSMSVVLVDVASGQARAVEITPPTGGTLNPAELGLSDITVLSDGRVAITASKEMDQVGKRVVAGQAWVSTVGEPWKQPGASWSMGLLAEFTDHKPEAVVQLGPHCAAVLFDDDERYKAQNRAAGGGPEWDSSSAFLSYVAIP